jgi:hypothetical protein
LLRCRFARLHLRRKRLQPLQPTFRISLAGPRGTSAVFCVFPKDGEREWLLGWVDPVVFTDM